MCSMEIQSSVCLPPVTCCCPQRKTAELPPRFSRNAVQHFTFRSLAAVDWSSGGGWWLVDRNVPMSARGWRLTDLQCRTGAGGGSWDLLQVGWTCEVGRGVCSRDLSGDTSLVTWYRGWLHDKGR